MIALAPLLAGLPLLGRWCTCRATAVAPRCAGSPSGPGGDDGAAARVRRRRAARLPARPDDHRVGADPQDGWTDELQRYVFLLDQIPMGSYAKRAAVLACLLALGWFAVLAVVARARRVAVPAPLLARGPPRRWGSRRWRSPRRSGATTSARLPGSGRRSWR